MDRTDPAPPPALEPPPAAGREQVAELPELPDLSELPDPLEVHEPSRPRRLRQPVDLARLLLTLLALAALLVLGYLAVATASGVESDVTGASRRLPGWLLGVLDLVVTLGLVAVPVALSVDQVLHRRAAWILDALLAAALGLALGLGLSWLLTSYGAADLLAALFGGVRRPQGALDPGLAALVGFVTVTGVNSRRRLSALATVVFAALALESVIGGTTTAFALIVSLLVGRFSGLAVRYALGRPNTRPDGHEVAAALRRIGIAATGLTSVPPAPDDSRRYDVATASGRHYDVAILDRDQQGAALVSRVGRRAWLRTPVQRRAILSLRAALDHEALLSYAATAAGARTPRLVAASDVGPDAALLAYEHVEGRRLAALRASEVPDGLLAQAWEQTTALAARRIASRSVTLDRMLVDPSGALWLVDVRSGEVAASDLQIRIEDAQLLASTALLVGVERALATALAHAGPDRVAAAVPLLQPLALDPGTRARLRGERGLLRRLREESLRVVDRRRAEDVRIQRLRPRTLVSVVGAAVAAYVLLTQLGAIDVGSVLREARWGWAGVAAALSVVTYVAAAMTVSGFTPAPLRPVRTVIAQVASSFVTLVAPAAVGGVALNTRYLQRSGVDGPLALASVGVGQVFALVFHVALLVVFGVMTGTQVSDDLLPSRDVLLIVVTVVLLVGALLAVPAIRRPLLARVRPTFVEVVPRLLDLLQSPRKLAVGVGGNLLLTFAYVLCLDASVRAFGGSPSFASVAAVYLAGSALGSAAPTPGGLGAVEAALAAGLTAASALPYQTAVSAVLLFRLLTFWLPVLPGWAAFSWMQRRHLV